jgi:hypothetical protein
MQLFSQRDPRWANHPLGWGPKDGTIGQYGCLDTVLAIIARDMFNDPRFTPASLDERFTNAKIFVKDSTGTFDLLPDNALELLYPASVTHTSITGFAAAEIAAAVKSPDTYAVLWISTASVPTHFVLAYSADAKYIADPWTGQVGLLSSYGGPAAVHKTLLIKKLAPGPVPAPAPAPAPVVAPTPVPVPTPVPAGTVDYGFLQTILIELIKILLQLGVKK